MDTSSMGVEDVERMRELVHRFSRAFDDWLVTQRVQSDPRRLGRRPTVVTNEVSRAEDVMRLAEHVRRWAAGAADAVELVGEYRTHQDPGFNAVREWESMRQRGTLIEPMDVQVVLGTTDELLGLVAARIRSGRMLFPVADPSSLHPLVWNSRVVTRWLRSEYYRVPEEAAAELHYQWARKFGYPKYPDGEGFWESLLSDTPGDAEQPRLRVQSDLDHSAPEAQRLLRNELIEEHRRALDLRAGLLTASDLETAALVAKWSSLAHELQKCRIET